MTHAAIYARKSTDQSNVVEEAKSVVRQVEDAQAFALAKGWIVSPAHIYIDDGISGAEFKRRPGFQRLMATLPHPPFQALVVEEQKALGREMSEVGWVIKQLAQAGVEIVESTHGRSLTPKNTIDKMMSSFQAGADEVHRVQTSERVHKTMTRKARTGHVTGGRVFGYDNRHVFRGEDASGNPIKSHVERVKNPVETAVVLRIFRLYDGGDGLKRIAKILTSEHAASPKPFVRVDPTKVLPIVGWSPSTVGAILARELYHGVIVWNRTRKRDDWGQVKQKERPESEWIRTVDESIRIVPEALWKRVQSRRQDTAHQMVRFESGRLTGGPTKRPTNNLLAGLATCALCGGGLIVETSPRKRGRIQEYLCSRRRYNGTCPNTLRIPAADLNHAVLRAIEEHALTPEAIEQVIHLSERDDVRDLQDKLARESKDIERRIERLVVAIETGGDAVPLVAKVRLLEKRKAEIAVESTSLHPIPRLPATVIEDRLAEWRRLLRGSTTQGRTVLQRILRGRLTFTPRQNPLTGEPDGYDFSGPTRFDKLFTGIAVETPPWIKASTTRRGFEGDTPDDTFDGDYGRLLDQVAREGVRPQRDSSKNASSFRAKFGRRDAASDAQVSLSRSAARVAMYRQIPAQAVATMTTCQCLLTGQLQPSHVLGRSSGGNRATCVADRSGRRTKRRSKCARLPRASLTTPNTARPCASA
jgi:DNA invertase Pin-like site-specific DNA recombinase